MKKSLARGLLLATAAGMVSQLYGAPRTTGRGARAHPEGHEQRLAFSRSRSPRVPHIVCEDSGDYYYPPQSQLDAHPQFQAPYAQARWKDFRAGHEQDVQPEQFGANPQNAMS